MMTHRIASNVLSLTALLPVLLQAVACTDGSAEDDVSAEEAAISRGECRGPREFEAACQVQGQVERQVVASLDPSTIGPVCVTYVLVGSRRYGLVQEAQACPNPSRFENARVRVSYSKGALVSLSRSKLRVLREHDSAATYYALSRPFTEHAVDGLAAFDALDRSAKVAALYAVADDESWATLRPEYQLKPIRIVDTLEGDALRAALSAYRELREYSFAIRGGRPDVDAIQKDGVTYAYVMSASGRTYGDWSALRIYDRQFNELAEFNYSE